MTPLSAQSFGVQFTLSQSEHELMLYAQELLPGDVREVFMRALKAHVRALEQRKFAATDQPRSACPRPTRGARHIPAPVRRAVWKRDGGRCTFVSETGHRCQATKHIQFDHIDPVARGGEATVSGIRLLCWAHNQHAAELTFGAEFMRHKRIAATDARATEKARDAAACLKRLGFRAEEIRRAEELWSDGSAPLEEMVRSALKSLCPKTRCGTSQAATG